MSSLDDKKTICEIEKLKLEIAQMSVETDLKNQEDYRSTLNQFCSLHLDISQDQAAGSLLAILIVRIRRSNSGSNIRSNLSQNRLLKG